VKVEEDPEFPFPLKAWERILERDPRLQEALNRFALRQALRTALILVPLTSGFWAILNGVVQLLGLGGEAWLISGLTLSAIGTVFTLMRLRR